MVENKQHAPAEMKREKEKTKQNHMNFNHSWSRVYNERKT